MRVYAQWKLTQDQLAEFELPGGGEIEADLPNKHKVFGIGPDVTLPIATKSKLFALVNVRYLWETGARSDPWPDAGRHRDLPRSQRRRSDPLLPRDWL